MSGGQMRGHQVEAIARAARVVAGSLPKTVVSVWPGGGKTTAALLFAAALLRAGVVSQVLYVCPNRSLVAQVRDAWARGAFGAGMRLATSSTDAAARVLDGVVLTYSKLLDNDLADYMRSAPTLLVLDEVHHLKDDASWLQAVLPLAQLAGHVFVMSGTLGRHDGCPIPFVDYDADGYPLVDISYDWETALRERAVLPTEYRRFSGVVSWAKGSRVVECQLSEAEEGDASTALRSAMMSESFRNGILRHAVDDFLDCLRSTPAAAMIVVAHDQSAARAMVDFLVRELRISAALAISDEPGAHHTIGEFRHGRGPRILVTVGMAYEGLDVPHLTHLVLLTLTRSAPWLQQAVARATRPDPTREYGRQIAVVYVPDDPAMREFVTASMSAQARALPPAIGGAERGAAEPSQTVFLGATLETEALLSDDEGHLTPKQSQAVAWVRAEFPLLRRIAARDLLQRTAALEATGFAVPHSRGSRDAEAWTAAKTAAMTLANVHRTITAFVQAEGAS